MGRKWLQKIETFLIVTIISVLVWLYADVQSVKPFSNQHVRIQLVPQPGLDLAIRPDTVFDVRLDFRASSRQKQRFNELNESLRPQGGALRVALDAPAPGGESTRTLHVADLLERSELNDLGLTITATEPADLPVRVEARRQVQLPVTVKADDLELAGEPVSETKRVTAAAPESFVPLLAEASVEADLTRLNLDNAADGELTTRTVELRLPPQVLASADDFQIEHTALNPAGITVSFTPQRKRREFVVKTIPISLDIQPSLLRTVHVDLPDEQLVLSQVKLTGPAAAIARIESGEFKVRAWVTITAQTVQDPTVVPRLELPPGVTPTDPLPPVDVRITPRP